MLDLSGFNRYSLAVITLFTTVLYVIVVLEYVHPRTSRSSYPTYYLSVFTIILLLVLESIHHCPIYQLLCIYMWYVLSKKSRVLVPPPMRAMPNQVGVSYTKLRWCSAASGMRDPNPKCQAMMRELCVFTDPSWSICAG